MSKNYPLSFTSASLMPHRSAALAELYVTLGDWEAVSTRVATDADLFGLGKASTRRRVFNELRLRLKTLHADEFELLAAGGAKAKRLLSWQAVCRSYPFIGTFTREVLLPKLERFDPVILNSDYRAFYREQTLVHGKLDRITETTRLKLESQTFGMLAEAGLIRSVKDRQITPPLPSPKLCTRVRAHDPAYLNYWLLSAL
ncbi:DUF1819 family protein [Neolewinella antarctica]|uniref:DUF1819 family protein n=1 Tax=Neolewinella antarctica TaxID=442734 RepID=A0ABX0XGN0_9BACT|nr:DUF1819 family protein [Neolewinella antarctica]NJC28494.1 hypothetical protein [Neolewinella antarctica]